MNKHISLFCEVFLKHRECCQPYDSFGKKAIIFVGKLATLVVSSLVGFL